MRARMMNGYWCFREPVGYKFKRVAGHGKLLVREEPAASIIAEALEGYAAGRFQNQAEVKRFLEDYDIFQKNKRGEISQTRAYDVLTRPIYAGYISHAGWDLHLVPGKHEGLITLETFEKIQKRLKGKAYAPARKDINADFPLRGFVNCDDCGKPLTACWSKGKRKKYPYYLCVTKGCPSRSKSIPRHKIEGEFEAIVRDLKPSRELFTVARSMFTKAWGLKEARSATRALALKQDIAKFEKQIQQFLERIVEASNTSVIAAYEKKNRRA